MNTLHPAIPSTAGRLLALLPGLALCAAVTLASVGLGALLANGVKLIAGIAAVVVIMLSYALGRATGLPSKWRSSSPVLIQSAATRPLLPWRRSLMPTAAR